MQVAKQVSINIWSAVIKTLLLSLVPTLGFIVNFLELTVGQDKNFHVAWQMVFEKSTAELIGDGLIIFLQNSSLTLGVMLYVFLVFFVPTSFFLWLTEWLKRNLGKQLPPRWRPSWLLSKHTYDYRLTRRLRSYKLKRHFLILSKHKRLAERVTEFLLELLEHRHPEKHLRLMSNCSAFVVFISIAISTSMFVLSRYSNSIEPDVLLNSTSNLIIGLNAVYTSVVITVLVVPLGKLGERPYVEISSLRGVALVAATIFSGLTLSNLITVGL